jgi:hypothetical protein
VRATERTSESRGEERKLTSKRREERERSARGAREEREGDGGGTADTYVPSGRPGGSVGLGCGRSLVRLRRVLPRRVLRSSSNSGCRRRAPPGPLDWGAYNGARTTGL